MFQRKPAAMNPKWFVDVRHLTEEARLMASSYPTGVMYGECKGVTRIHMKVYTNYFSFLKEIQPFTKM